MEAPKKGSQVRIIKDGDDGSGKNPFFKDQIWEADGKCTDSVIYAIYADMRTKLAWRDCGGYDQECEPIDVKHELPIFN